MGVHHRNFRKIVSGWRTGVACSMAALMGVLAVGAERASAQEIKENWVTVVLQSEPETLDPCMASRSVIGTVIFDNVLETLVTLNYETGELMPQLATSWEQVDPRTWRFKLREGITFHDGAPFNAEAAIKAMNRSANPNLACGSWLSAFNDLKITARAIDEYTLELQSDEPEPIMATRMVAVAMYSPNTPEDQLVLNPVGTGPYIFQNYAPGQEVTMTRNDAYWGDEPEVEGARFVFRKESAVRAAMVKNGEADIAPQINQQDAGDPELDHPYPVADVSYFRIDTFKAPLDDLRVRLAMNYAIDRAAMIGTLVPEGTRNATQLVLPLIPGHNYELEKNVREFDPEKARQLIAEAKADGVPVDRQIEMISFPDSFPGAGDISEAVFEMLRNVGFNLRVVSLEQGASAATLNRPFKEDREPNIVLSKHDNTRGDPVFSLYLKYGCEGRQSAVCDPRVDAAMAAATETPAGPERVAKWQSALALLYNDVVPEVWLFNMVGTARISNRIDFEPNISSSTRLPIAKMTFN